MNHIAIIIYKARPSSRSLHHFIKTTSALYQSKLANGLTSNKDKGLNTIIKQVLLEAGIADKHADKLIHRSKSPSNLSYTLAFQIRVNHACSSFNRF